MDTTEETPSLDLAAERLKLEREALNVERKRLLAEQIHAEAEAKLARARHPFLLLLSVFLFSLLCFAGGVMSGITIMENRQQRLRAERLERALSQIGTITSDHGTNSLPASVRIKTPEGAHRDVAVVVIQ